MKRFVKLLVCLSLIGTTGIFAWLAVTRSGWWCAALLSTMFASAASDEV